MQSPRSWLQAENVDQCRLKRQTKRQEISLVTKETNPPYELYASFHGNELWHCPSSISRILYLDTDILVTGSLWHLLQLPAAVHFAASGLGASSENSPAAVIEV